MGDGHVRAVPAVRLCEWRVFVRRTVMCLCDPSRDWLLFGQSIPNNGTLWSAYETSAAYLCRFQVTLAGYRLAAILDSIFDSPSYIDVVPSRLRGAEPSSRL